MGSSHAAATTPEARIDAALNLMARTLSPGFLADPRFAELEIPGPGGKRIALRDKAAAGSALDAAACCTVICLARPGTREFPVRDKASAVRDMRNTLAHRTREEIREDEAVATVSRVVDILHQLGFSEAAQKAARFRGGPVIRFARDLRRYLVEVAESKRLVTYEEALIRLKRTRKDLTMSQFLRQLNVLAAMQMMLGEPQLCSLVVLPGSKRPGDGFYWSIDIDNSAPETQKIKAHDKELRRVRQHQWPPATQEVPFPWS